MSQFPNTKAEKVFKRHFKPPNSYFRLKIVMKEGVWGKERGNIGEQIMTAAAQKWKSCLLELSFTFT